MNHYLDNIYPERGTDQDSLLQRHSFSSLASRREMSCARFLCQLLHGKIDAPFLLPCISFHVPRLELRHINTFYLPASRTDIFRRSTIATMCSNADQHCRRYFSIKCLNYQSVKFVYMYMYSCILLFLAIIMLCNWYSVGQ